jgi:hypothetical protein
VAYGTIDRSDLGPAGMSGAVYDAQALADRGAASSKKMPVPLLPYLNLFLLELIGGHQEGDHATASQR